MFSLKSRDVYEKPVIYSKDAAWKSAKNRSESPKKGRFGRSEGQFQHSMTEKNQYFKKIGCHLFTTSKKENGNHFLNPKKRILGQKRSVFIPFKGAFY